MAENKTYIPAGGEVIRFFGIAPFDFVPEGGSERISGVNLWFMKERKGAYGYVPDKVKMSVQDFNESCKACGVVTADELLNRDLVCLFNRYGKCNSFYYA